MNNSWIPLVTLALALGVRHGFDLDHLATIDSISRTVRDAHYLSKIVGFLFSLGHGLVVTLISLIIGSGIIHSRFPSWLNGLGNSISILFLLMFGILTLWNVLKYPSQPAAATGMGAFLLRIITIKKYKPALIMLVGALFAFSFDTFSQVALFSISASLLGGWLFSGVLGVVFMFGMMTSDGLNGLLVSALIQRSGKKSLIVSRLFGLIIASFSLVIGMLSLTKLVYNR